MPIPCSLLKLKLKAACGRVGTGMALALTLALPALASTELVLGQSAALSGPSGMLGSEYRQGALAYFAEVNRQGGVHGKRLKLLSLDDRYDPTSHPAQHQAAD